MNQLITKRNTVKTKVLAMSPLSLALAACGGGGGSSGVSDNGSEPIVWNGANSVKAR